MTTISVLIIDDHTLLRETLRSRLDSEADLEVVADVGDAQRGVELARELAPNVVLMDVDMPGRSCFDAAKEILRERPETRILFLSAHSHDRFIASALDAQAVGYVTKDEHPGAVVEAIRAVASGRRFFSERVLSRLVLEGDEPRVPEHPRTRASLLTARELEVLRYIASGLPKKEIATHMFVSVKTVNRHTENLMRKLEIHDRVELTRFAIREGLSEA